jgi:hypothetical protein
MRTRRDILAHPHQMTASVRNEEKFQNEKFYSEKELLEFVDDYHYLIHECDADVIDVKDLLEFIKEE